MNTYTSFRQPFAKSAPTTSPGGHFGGRITFPTHSEPSHYTADLPQGFINPPYGYVPNMHSRPAPIVRNPIGFPSRYSASHSQARPNWSAQMDAGTPFTNLGQFLPGHFEQPTRAYDTTYQAGLEFDMDPIFGGISGASTTGVSSHLSPHPFSQPIAPPPMQICDPIPIQFNQAPSLPTLPAHESAFLSGSSLHDLMDGYRQQRGASSRSETNPGVFNQEQGQEVFQPAHVTSPSYTGEDNAPTPALSIEETNSELYMSSNNTPLASNVALADDSIESFCISSFPADLELQQTLREVMSVVHTPAVKDQASRLLRVNNDQPSRTWSCLFGGVGGTCGPEFKRRDIGVSHILKNHLRISPVRCGGDCGDPQCQRRFPSASAKSSHIRTGQKRTCDRCYHEISSRNYSRHRKSCKCHSTVTSV